MSTVPREQIGELFAGISLIFSLHGTGLRRKNRANCSEIQLVIAPVSIRPSTDLKLTCNARKFSFGSITDICPER
jgi:hypothetical protein